MQVNASVRSGDAGALGGLTDLYPDSSGDCSREEEEKMMRRMIQKMEKVYSPSALSRLMVSAVPPMTDKSYTTN